MRRSARPMMREDMDDLEDKSWKRKSYALAQHNALPIPMPHPVYPPPVPCPPPAVVIRPSRLRSRPPGAGYRHPASYHPVLRQNYYQTPPPPPPDRLPTLSEMNAEALDLPVRKAPPPPREIPAIQTSHREHDGISSSPPELSTFRAPPAKPIISPVPPPLRSNNIHASPQGHPHINDSFTKPSNIPVPQARSNHIPVPQTRSNHIPASSTTRPHHILPPQQSHVDTLVPPSMPIIHEDSAAPRRDTVHPTFTTFAPQPPPEPTTAPSPTITSIPQETHNSLPSPPTAPKTPPSLPSKPPPQVHPKGPKIDQSVPSPPSPARRILHTKKVAVPPRPKEAPPAVPSPAKQSEFTPESKESLPSNSESFITQPKPVSRHSESSVKPAIPSKPAIYPSEADGNYTSILVSPAVDGDAEQDTSRICTPPTGNNSENKSPTMGTDSLHEDSSPGPQVSRIFESPTAEPNFTAPSSVGVSSLHEDPNSTPQISKISESLTTEPSSTTTSPLPDDKTDPQPVTPASQHLPLTPSSQSRSSSLASIGCPRTPTSIRAAPSWQPMFPATPLTRGSTSASNSESSLSPRSSNATPRPAMAPEGCQNFLPTPPSSPSQTRVDSVTPASSISSFPHGHGQSVTGEEEEEEEEEMQHQAAPAEDYPGPARSSTPDTTTLPNDDKAIVPVVNNTSGTEELGVTPTKPLPATETFQTYKTRFWILTVYSFICFLQTIVWGTFGPIAESAQAAFPSWDDSTIAAFPNWGPIVVVVFIIPMMWLSQKLGLQIAMITCEAFLTLGTMLRCFTSQEEIFTVMCHVSSVLFAFAACFTLSLPAMLAATWFPPSERITATAVGTLMCQLGGAAMYLGALVVRYPSSSDVANLTEEEREDIRGDIMVLMYIHFGIALLLLLAVVVYFPSRPPTPPSASSTEERIDYFKAMKMMFMKLQMVLVLLVFAFSFGVPVVWVAVLNLSLKDIGINQDKAMGVAVTAIICSCVTAFIAARITDKMYGHLKETVMVLLGISSVFFLWFLLLTTQVIYPTLGQVYVAVAGGLAFEYATAPLLVELAVEIGFPIPESVTGATLTFVFNLVSLVFLGLFQIPNDSHLWVSCVLLACISLSIIPLFFVKETHKRSDTDRKFM